MEEEIDALRKKPTLDKKVVIDQEAIQLNKEKNEGKKQKIKEKK